MDITVIAELLQIALPVGLIIIGVWFFINQLWPTWVSRDTEERQRRHERELRRGDTSAAIAAHLSVIAHGVTHLIDANFKRDTPDC